MTKLILIFLFLSIELFGIPRFSLMRGNQCRDCHYNPTGGIIRNKDGWTYGKNNLRVFRANTSELSPFINENISIGLDFRYQYLYSQKLKRTDFHKMAASMYSNLNLSEEINFITKYDFYRGYFEGFGVLNVLPFEGYLKVGSFFPSFGVRIDDHTAYTRNGDAGVLSASLTPGLIFESGYSQTGIELGFFPNEFVFLSLSAGQTYFPFRSDLSYVGRIEVNPSFNQFNFLAGTSYGVFRKFNEISPFSFTSFFGGIGNKSFSILGEIVFVRDYILKDTSSLALFVETSYRLIHGVDFVARYDRFVPNTKNGKDFSSHIILGFDLFPYSFVEIKPQFRFNLENQKIEKNNSFVLQFHFWY